MLGHGAGHLGIGILFGVVWFVGALIVLAVIVGLIVLLVRFLLVGTRAAQVYLREHGEDPRIGMPRAGVAPSAGPTPGTAAPAAPAPAPAAPAASTPEPTVAPASPAEPVAPATAASAAAPAAPKRAPRTRKAPGSTD